MSSFGVNKERLAIRKSNGRLKKEARKKDNGESMNVDVSSLLEDNQTLRKYFCSKGVVNKDPLL